MKLEGIAASALALALAAGVPHPAEAQGAAAEEEQDSAIEEIIVTARKREESLQNVPLAITALDADALDSVGARGLEDIAARTVGFTYEPFANAGNTGYPVIRGLSTSFVSARVQNVGVFMDGIYLQRQGMFDPGLLDVERVEVVKGPQNALYGRNAFAGAINYVTGQPSAEPAGHLSAESGSGERRSIKAQLAGPIRSENLFGKVAFGASRFDGHTRNEHPNAGLDLGGATTTDDLGGWDDWAGSVALTYNALDFLSFGVSYYHNQTKREPAPYYVLWGANSGRVGFSQHGDLNCNQAVRAGFGGAPATVGNTLWCGELPNRPPAPGAAFQNQLVQPATIPDPANPGQTIPNPVAGQTIGSPFPIGGTGPGPDTRRSGILVDPRSVGLDAETSIATFRADWEIGNDISLSYLFGWTDYDAFTNGGNADRNPLVGSRITLPNKIYTTDPDGPGPRMMGPVITNPMDPSVDFTTFHVNQFSGRPITELSSTSHELRAEWSYGDFEVSGGLYYSDVEDEEYFQEYYAPLLGTTPTSQHALYSGHYTPGDFVDIPTGAPPPAPATVSVPTSLNINTDLFSTNADGLNVLNPANFIANPVQAELTRFDDQVAAAFASASYDFLSVWRVALEARFTREDKKVKRITPSLNQQGRTALNCQANPDPQAAQDPSPPGCATPVGQVYNFSGAPLEDEEEFTYITPRLTVEWRGLPDTLIYAYGASGVKAGGFNNAVRMDQLSYDEETNITGEIGVKSSLLEGRLQLNAAAFYVDWEDMQVQETQLDNNGAPIAGANFVIGNLGGATNFGFELEGSAALNDSLTMLFGFSSVNPKFKDGTIYQEAIGTIGCSTTAGAPLPCSNPAAAVAARTGNGDVSGKTLPRTSERQAYLGFVQETRLPGGFNLTFGVDSTFQSKQWVSPLNLAHNGDRILVNANISLSPLGQVGAVGAWRLTFWGRNIFDEEYVGGVFHVAFLNQYLVAKGAGATWGANLRYDF